jgi:hypothetical protein
MLWALLKFVHFLLHLVSFKIISCCILIENFKVSLNPLFDAFVFYIEFEFKFSFHALSIWLAWGLRIDLWINDGD